MCTKAHTSHADHAFQLEPAEIGDRRRPPDRRQVAQVTVVKRRVGLVLDRALDVRGGVPAHLDRDLRDAGQRLAGRRR